MKFHNFQMILLFRPFSACWKASYASKWVSVFNLCFNLSTGKMAVTRAKRDLAKLHPEPSMTTRFKGIFLSPALVAALGLFQHVTAQTFTNLHSFNGFDGYNLQAGLVISGNTLYGAADSGGFGYDGALFVGNTDGSGFANLYSFTNSPSGQNPDGTLILSSNTLYGTTYYGGNFGAGTVFAINTNGMGLTNLHSFSGNDGNYPEVGLTLSGNTLYGTTEGGGSLGSGVLFKVNTDGSGFTNLHNFNGASDGAVPHAVLISSGIVYGTAIRGGTNGNGTVFAINTNGTGFTILHTFKAGSGSFPKVTNSDGAFPVAGLILGNTLYGTAYSGGTNGNGTVFAINTNGTSFTNLYFFTATSGSNLTNSDGANPGPNDILVLLGNTLYGTAYSGGISGNGTVFAVNTNGTGFTTLHSFTVEIGGTNGDASGTNSDGASPYAGLILSGNTLYGTTKSGGSLGFGTAFALALPPPSPQLTLIYSGANVILTWPTNTARFILQSTTNLAPPAVWTTNSPAPVVVNTNNVVTNTISGTQKFYRLSQ
jgi:uncharacterized repeat protein (TIGR03803 family)